MYAHIALNFTVTKPTGAIGLRRASVIGNGRRLRANSEMESSTSVPINSSTRWPLVVMSMKRQAGRMSPPRLNTLTDSSVNPREELTAPSGSVLYREGEESWRELEKGFPGIALATTATLLAALWLDDHFVFDWRVQVAADALRVHAGLEPTPKTQREIQTRKWQRPSFEDYSTVRGWLKTIGCPLRTSERALYRLSYSVPTVRGRSWQDYAQAAARKLECI